MIGNLGRDPEQRESRANGAPFIVLSVATRRGRTPKAAGSRAPTGTGWCVFNAPVKLSSRGRHLVASDTGHWIHLDRPELIIQAIRQVVAVVRSTARMEA